MKDANLDSIIEKAIANEEEANQFYLKLSQIADKSAKDTLIFLAGEEKKHKEYLLRCILHESFIANATRGK